MVLCSYLQIIKDKTFSTTSHFRRIIIIRSCNVIVGNMNTIGVVGVLAFLIISPAICDEGNKNVLKEIVTQNPQPYLNSFSNEFANGNSWYNRQLRGPSGFVGMRGKKDYEDDDSGDAIDWNVEVHNFNLFSNR